MIARMLRVEATAEQIDALVSRYRNVVRPIHAQAAGLRKHYVLVDRQNGRIAIVGVWDSPEALAKAASVLEPARERLWSEFGHMPPVENYEVADELGRMRDDEAAELGAEEEIIRLEHELQEAVGRQDREALERLVAPGFRVASTAAMGNVSRERWIASATGPFRQRSAELSNYVVTIDGDTAVVTRRGSQDASLGDQQAHRDWFITDVWVKRGSGWQVLVRHAERVHAAE